MSDSNNIDYFVSFAVMEGAGGLGHGFLLISQLDHSQGRNARMEVVTALGFYSRHMPVLGYKPVSVGKIKVEHMKWIANQEGLAHETYQVNFSDVKKVLDRFFDDKLLISLYDEQLKNNGNSEYSSVVPMFNVFKKQNCKDYALRALEEIGIDISHLRSLMEIPKMVPLDKMYISSQKLSDNDTAYYWDTPMRFKQKSRSQAIARHDNIQQLNNDMYLLGKHLDKMLRIVRSRQSELNMIGKSVPEVNVLYQDLKSIKSDMQKTQVYPKLLSEAVIKRYARQITGCIDNHIQSFERKDIEHGLIGILKAVIKEMMLSIRATLFSLPQSQLARCNALDRTMLDEVYLANRENRLRT